MSWLKPSRGLARSSPSTGGVEGGVPLDGLMEKQSELGDQGECRYFGITKGFLAQTLQGSRGFRKGTQRLEIAARALGGSGVQAGGPLGAFHSLQLGISHAGWGRVDVQRTLVNKLTSC